MSQNTLKKSRNSSIELLRIISIIMILFLHINKDMMFVNDFQMSMLSSVIMFITESLSIVAVNCFILITGYFSVNSDTFKIRKAVNLVAITSFYGIAIYFVLVAFGAESFGIKQLIKCALPYFFDKVWFINIYIVLYLFIPFINKALKALSIKGYTILLILLLLIFSVWPTFIPNPPYNDYGYSIVSFVMIYCIGGYLKLHFNKKVNCAVWLAGYVILSAVTCVLLKFRGTHWIDYNSVFVVLASVCLFMFFASFNFSSKIINYISLSVLSVFIIHAHQCIRPTLFTEIFDIDSRLNSNLFILYYVSAPLIIFVICIVIDILRRYLFKYTVDKALDKIKPFNFSQDV